MSFLNIAQGDDLVAVDHGAFAACSPDAVDEAVVLESFLRDGDSHDWEDATAMNSGRVVAPAGGAARSRRMELVNPGRIEVD